MSAKTNHKEGNSVVTCFQLCHETDDLLTENTRCNDALIAVKTERQRKRKHRDSLASGSDLGDGSDTEYDNDDDEDE